MRRRRPRGSHGLYRVSTHDNRGTPVEEPAPSSDVPEAVVPEETLTAESSADLAAVLIESDNCADSIEGFAATHQGQTIAFDGNIATMNNHGDRDTRYDILVAPGDFSETTQAGPSFQFRDVGISDLGLTGPNAPDSISPGDNLKVVAQVGEFVSDQCLFLLDPVSTEVR